MSLANKVGKIRIHQGQAEHCSVDTFVLDRKMSHVAGSHTRVCRDEVERMNLQLVAQLLRKFGIAATEIRYHRPLRQRGKIHYDFVQWILGPFRHLNEAKTFT